MILEPVRLPPRQARSRDSERRLLGAARDLLDARSWDEITVAEIAGRAGLAVGAFYARFESKEALLRHLEAEVEERSRSNAERLARLAAEGATPHRLLRELVAGHIALYREHSQVARAMVVRSQVDTAARERLRELSRETYAVVARALADAGLRIDAPAARRAAEYALYVERSVLREAILFGTGWSKERHWTDAQIARETVRLLACYLGLELPGSTAADRAPRPNVPAPRLRRPSRSKGAR